MSDTDSNSDQAAQMREVLQQMGHKVDDDPMAALDINSHEVIRLPLTNEEAPEQETSGELRRTPGGVFDSGEREGTGPKDPWSREINGLGVVSVTESEREDYWRALWAETQFSGQVTLEMPAVGEMHFVFRSMSQGTKEIVAAAVDKLVKAHPIRTIDNVRMAEDYYMRIRLIIQLKLWWNEHTRREFQPYDAALAPDELVENCPQVDELARLGRTWFNGWSDSVIRTAFRALHVFETKLVILEDAAINQTF